MQEMLIAFLLCGDTWQACVPHRDQAGRCQEHTEEAAGAAATCGPREACAELKGGQGGRAGRVAGADTRTRKHV